MPSSTHRGVVLAPLPECDRIRLASKCRKPIAALSTGYQPAHSWAASLNGTHADTHGSLLGTQHSGIGAEADI